jgi:predicted GNAT family acetyltransferase
LARKVTRALLAEARASGAREAILFSNNDAASRAYRSIGFEQVGQYRIAFLHSPRQVPA